MKNIEKSPKYLRKPFETSLKNLDCLEKYLFLKTYIEKYLKNTGHIGQIKLVSLNTFENLQNINLPSWAKLGSALAWLRLS